MVSSASERQKDGETWPLITIAKLIKGMLRRRIVRHAYSKKTIFLSSHLISHVLVSLWRAYWQIHQEVKRNVIMMCARIGIINFQLDFFSLSNRFKNYMIEVLITHIISLRWKIRADRDHQSITLEKGSLEDPRNGTGRRARIKLPTP